MMRIFQSKKFAEKSLICICILLVIVGIAAIALGGLRMFKE